MRIVVLLLTLGLLASCEEKVVLPELSHENIKYLTINNMSPEHLNQLAERYLEQKKIFEPESVSEDDTQNLQMVLKELEAKRASNPVLFEYVIPFNNRQINPKENTVNFSFPFKFEQLVVSETNMDYVFPPYIYLLFANLDQLYAIPGEQIDGLGDGIPNLTVVYQIEIVKPQHQKYMQAIVKEMNVYSGRDMKDLVYTFKETRQPIAIVNDRLLPNGYSLDLVPVHSFSFFSQRLLDPLYDYSSYKEFCTKKEPILNHDVLSCQYKYYEGEAGRIDVEVIVIGGRNAHVKLLADGMIPAPIKEKTLAQISKDLNVPVTYLSRKTANIKPNKALTVKKVNAKTLEWESFGVNIVFHRDALDSDVEGQRTIIQLTGKAWLDYKAERTAQLQ